MFLKSLGHRHTWITQRFNSGNGNTFKCFILKTTIRLLNVFSFQIHFFHFMVFVLPGRAPGILDLRGSTIHSIELRVL